MNGKPTLVIDGVTTGVLDALALAYPWGVDEEPEYERGTEWWCAIDCSCSVCCWV